jgi:hypothetical protein
MQLARADIGISVALENTKEGRGELEKRQADIQRRMREVQQELNRPAPRPENPQRVSPTVENRQQALGQRENPARKGAWLRVPAEGRWGRR